MQGRFVMDSLSKSDGEIERAAIEEAVRAASSPSRLLQHNLAMLRRRAERERSGRGLWRRICDSVTRAAGEPWFTGMHVVSFAAWILINAGWAPGIPAFDPFPFPFL